MSKSDVDVHPERLRELSLFSGAGGGLLASRLLGWRTVCYVEREPYCQRVIRARIEDGLLDDAPIWDDVKTFDGRPWRGLVDVISAGFPCQPFSVAGKKRAADDDRNGWPDTIRIIREVRPAFAFLENVPGLLAASHGYFGTLLGALAESGYDAVWDCLSAASCGAPHIRDRLWVLAADSRRDGIRQLAERHQQHQSERWASESAHDGASRKLADPDSRRRPRQQFDLRKGEPRTGSGRPDVSHAQYIGRAPLQPPVADPDEGRCEEQRVSQSSGIESPRRDQPDRRGALRQLEHSPSADSYSQRCEEQRRAESEQSQPRERGLECGCWWATEPEVGRMAHGVADRVGQQRALGNGQVPIVAATAWGMLMRAYLTEGSDEG